MENDTPKTNRGAIFALAFSAIFGMAVGNFVSDIALDGMAENRTKLFMDCAINVALGLLALGAILSWVKT
jgi:hypothetical protein